MINTTVNDNIFAAIDLGSNSFHLIVTEVKNDQLLIIDRMKEMVRLASGLDEKGDGTDGSFFPVNVPVAGHCIGNNSSQCGYY